MKGMMNLEELRRRIDADYLADEARMLQELLPEAALDEVQEKRIVQVASGWVEALRKEGVASGSLEAFLHEYDLSTEEGVILMCLAEALLRIPDAVTANALIEDKLVKGDWDHHLGQSSSMLVNAATWGLMLSGRMVHLPPEMIMDTPGMWRRLTSRLGEPVIRRAMQQSMRILGRQFVMGETIDQALKRSRADKTGLTYHSYDMLGESAVCAADVERYCEAYSAAVAALAAQVDRRRDIYERPGISVKLSALHPRYEIAQRERVMQEMVPRVLAIARQAREAGITMTLDAEECERLTLMLDIFQAVYLDSSLADWPGLGIAVQAYHKRAPAVLNWVIALARHTGKRVPLRLVKGAYWDSEIKRAQQQGLAGYPVYTRKQSSDVSFLACARHVLLATDALYPQFATHNARTIATICVMARGDRDYEFQRLHGMGEALYARVQADEPVPCRVYAPVGDYESLLPYLVRRLLENGANTSFINRVWDERLTIDEIVTDPAARLSACSSMPNPGIPLPEAIYGGDRRNSAGINLADESEITGLTAALNEVLTQTWRCAPLVDGQDVDGEERDVADPADTRRVVGRVVLADAALVARSLEVGQGAVSTWDRTPVAERAQCLLKAAELMEQHRAVLLALVVREAGKTVPDAIAELREAVDFCRYYAQQILEGFAAPRILPGPTGERNELYWGGRGVFVCISPWNFPLAIFTGQISAALAAGNCVIAKPAHQTPLIAWQVVRLFHEAGVPGDVLQLLPCSGTVLGEAVLGDARVAGVAFTGSTETAWRINRQLAARQGPIVPLIAETGGQNAMIADSSALVEQVVKDAIRSAFNSAGQRCSALRVLFLQRDIAPRTIDLLRGAMEELRLGDPLQLSTDVGPVIDEESLDKLVLHAERLGAHDKLLHRMTVPAGLDSGYFVPPCLFRLDHLSELHHEVFGPMLHVVEYDAGRLDAVIEAINSTGYGLTLGIHSRIEHRIEYIRSRARVGNMYINRDMIGAVVGAQPFGGEGLSGTGFKAGGPHYLHRFATERTLSTNIAALGGNTQLLSLGDPD